MRNLALTALLAAGIATPAVAQDMNDRGFSGLYVGVAGGGASQSNQPDARINFDRNGDGNFNDTVRTAAGADAFSPGFCPGTPVGNSAAQGCNSARGGYDVQGHVGFDAQMAGGLVVGAVAQYGYTDVFDSVTGFSTTPASYTMVRRLKHNGTLRARAGFTPNNTTLFYGTGGLAYGRVTDDFRSSNVANDFAKTGDRDAWGYAAGGGVEQKLGANVSIGVEYLYTRLRDDKSRVLVTQGRAPVTNPFVLGGGTTTFARSERNFDWHGVRGTLNFRF